MAIESMVIGWKVLGRLVMKWISWLERSPLCFHSSERALNYSWLGYLPVVSKKNMASGRGSIPPYAFCAFEQNSGMECPLKVIPVIGSRAEPS
jgi:hypothetical protein